MVAKEQFPKRVTVLILLSAWMMSAGTLAAQQPDVAHARIQNRPVTSGLDNEFQAVLASDAGPAWIGYAVPLIPGNQRMCCSGCERWDKETEVDRCRLEGGKSYDKQSVQPERVKLEGPKQMWVLFRAASSRVEKIRVFSDDCRLDAGGLPFYWLTGVPAAESVQYLSGFVRETASKSDEDAGETHTSQGALAAIAFTDDPAADRAFDRFVAAESPAALRGHAAFWLGAARGQHGLEVLKRMVQADPSEHVREQAVFGLSVSKQTGSLQVLIDAVHHGSAGVRGQAIFWLAQKAGKKAAETITAAIQDDPETEVKKRAVFALSQLPADEGVPLLIKVARTNRNAEVRKQAIFWLGQSKDPRAWAFIEDVLTH